MQNTPVIKTTNLSYSYSNKTEAISNINMVVDKGSIYGFLGPNGSGKTTTLSLLLGLFKQQKGTIEIFGEKLEAARSEILKKTGSLIEIPSLYGHLTAKENLEVYRNIYKVSKSRINEVLHLAGLAYTGKKTVKKFSLGMKQRLSIALALLPDPELLILDEPANGLDPEGIRELRELIMKLNTERGITIIISSHILAEIEKMVSQVGIIHKGKMVFQGTLSDLHFQHENLLQLHTSDNEKAVQLLQQYNPETEGELVNVFYHNKEQAASINRILMNNQLDVYLLQPKKNNLEQIFIDLIEKS
jgi:lantibiotic transport system ATP-binding protein